MEIEKIADDIRQKTGQEPIVVGMSKWSVASSMLFYNKGKNIMDIRSRNMFGDTGSMFEFWSPSQLPSTRPIIMVSMKRNRLEHGPLGNDLNQLLDQPGPILSRTIKRNNKKLRDLYYRVARGYLGNNKPAKSYMN